MLPPFLHLIASQPQLVVDHAEAYAELLGHEVAQASTRMKRRMVLGAVALCSLAVAAVLGGVALMLAAVVPDTAAQPARWLLWATPLLPLAVAAGCGWALSAGKESRPFSDIRSQLKADMAMLREASTP